MNADVTPAELVRRTASKARRDGLMPLVTRSGDFTETAVHRWTVSRRRVRELLQSDDEALRRIGVTLWRGRNRAVRNDQERQWIESLEEVRNSILNSTDTIEDWGHEEPVAELAMSSQPCCLLLFGFVRQFQPQQALELGASVGMSAMYQAAALESNGAGELTTIEASEPRADIAASNFDRVGLTNVDVVCGRFHDQLQDVLEEQGSVDLAYIDGHHEGSATIEYFDEIAPYLSHDAPVIFDDTDWSDDMAAAWEMLCKDDRLDPIVESSGYGIALAGGSRGRTQPQRIVL